MAKLFADIIIAQQEKGEKTMPVHDNLGTRMKTFYEQVPKTRLVRRMPVALRMEFLVCKKNKALLIIYYLRIEKEKVS